MLENGSDLYVNHQKIRHYCARLTKEEERRMPNLDVYVIWCICKLCYYSDVIYSFNWKSTVEQDGGV